MNRHTGASDNAVAAGPATFHSRSGRAAAGFWLFALVWNAISWPVAVAGWRDAAGKSDRVVLLILIGIFPVVGLVMLAVAVRATLQWLKFGRVELVLEAAPVALGSTMRGQLRGPGTLAEAKTVQFSLQCTRLVTSGSGRNRSTRRKLLWENQCRISPDNVKVAQGQAIIPVQFTIPYEQQESDTQTRVQWRLRADADLSGVDFSAEFELPVRRTDASDPTLTEQAIAAATMLLPENEQADIYADAKIRLLRRGDAGLQVIVPTVLGRSPGTIVGLGVFAAIWAAAVVFMATHGAPVFMSVIFGLFEVLFLMGIGSFATKRISTRFTAQGLEVRKSHFFVRSTKRIALQQITGFEHAMTGSSSSGSRQKGHYRVSVSAGGDSVELAHFLSTKQQACWLQGVLEEHYAKLTEAAAVKS